MRIAVFHNLPSGGALRTLYDKIRRLEERGNSVSIYTFDTSERSMLPPPQLTGEFVTRRVGFRGLWRFQRYFDATRDIAKKINSSKTDWVFVDKCRFFGAPPLLQFLRKPNVFYCHEPLGLHEYSALSSQTSLTSESLVSGFLRLPWRKKLKKVLNGFQYLTVKRVDQKSIRCAQKVMTSSCYAAQWVKRVYGIESLVTYQGVDTDWFSPGAGVKKENQVLSVGRMEQRKNHDFLVRVLARLSKSCRPQLTIVCDDIDEDYCSFVQKEANALGVEMKIYHRPAQNDLLMLYRQSRLVLCAAIREPFGLVPLEAMACGIPVIAMRDGGFPESIVDNETGFLLRADEEEWSKKIRECLNAPDRMNQIGETGRNHVLSKWTWDLFIDKLSGVYL